MRLPCGGIAAVYLIFASLIISLWVYDLSPLYEFLWARRVIATNPVRILNLHSGFDESSLALQKTFANAQLVVMDFYDPKTMTEPSIKRARRHQERRRPEWLTAMTWNVDSSALPVGDQNVDAAFAILAAHEIRNPEDRLKFFREVARCLDKNGRFVLVEHLRNPANFLAFGPQFTHFYSRAVWLELGRQADFEIVEESRITPFIGLFVFQIREPDRL